MEKASVDGMELGNIIFGNSRGLYHVTPREEYQDVFCEFLHANGFDMYGYKEGYKSREYDNGTFVIRPYYWGEDEEIAALPNFEFRPAGLQIKWYKYPMRDAYSNLDISVDELKRMLAACAASMRVSFRGERSHLIGEPCEDGIVWTDTRSGKQTLERYDM